MADNIYNFTILRHLRRREGLSIEDLAEMSSVSPAVISKLERNMTTADLSTLHRLARAYGMTPSELLALVETTPVQRARESGHEADGFTFREVSYGNIKCLYGTARAGAEVARPQAHSNDYELCWVLRGKIGFTFTHEYQELSAGDALQFDALLNHSYQALEDCEILLLHIRKGKRF